MSEINDVSEWCRRAGMSEETIREDREILGHIKEARMIYALADHLRQRAAEVQNDRPPMTAGQILLAMAKQLDGVAKRELEQEQ